MSATIQENPRDLSDELLVERSAAHDRDAFLALYDRYSPRMLGLIMRVTRDKHAAEDVLQKCMLEVWTRHAQRYQPALGSVESWLLRLARSRAIDHTRSSSRHPFASIDETLDHDRAAPAAGGLDHAQRSALDAALSQLPEEERRPVVLAYLHGLSREQIAEHVGVPVGTVKTRIRRGIHRLRDNLKIEGAIVT